MKVGLFVFVKGSLCLISTGILYYQFAKLECPCKTNIFYSICIYSVVTVVKVCSYSSMFIDVYMQSVHSIKVERTTVKV